MIDGQVRADIGRSMRIRGDSWRLVVSGILPEDDIMTGIDEERSHGSDSLEDPIPDIIGFC